MATTTANIPKNFPIENIVYFFRSDFGFSKKQENVLIPKNYRTNVYDTVGITKDMFAKQTQIPAKSPVKYLQKFSKEYQLFEDRLPFTEAELRIKLDKSIHNFLVIVTEFETAFSIELTQDATFFYTIKKGDLTFFVEQDLIGEDLTEEFVLTAFNKKSIIISKMGTKATIINAINEHFNTKN